jgi:hypothetical protein
MKEGENVGLGSYGRHISLWSAAIQNISGDCYEGRRMALKRRYHGRRVCIMEIGEQGDGRGTAWEGIDCFVRRDHLLMRSLPWKRVHSKWK